MMTVARESTAIKQKVDSLQENAISFNNKAVQHLVKSNDYETASHLLRKALTACMMVMKLTEKNVTTPAVAMFQWSSQIGLRDERKEEEGRFVFRRGIFIHSSSAMTTSTSSIAMIKAAVCFNAALTHHILATTTLDDHTNSDLSLQRTKLLYSLSYQIIQKQQQQQSKHQCQSRNFLKAFYIALLNNFGQVSFDLVDYRTSKKCFDRLKRHLVYFLRTKKRTEFCQRDLISMHFNTVLGIPMTAPCA